MKYQAPRFVMLALFTVLSACSPKQKDEARTAAAGKDTAALLSVGSIRVDQADLDYQLKESHGGSINEETRKNALGELAISTWVLLPLRKEDDSLLSLESRKQLLSLSTSLLVGLSSLSCISSIP